MKREDITVYVSHVDVELIDVSGSVEIVSIAGQVEVALGAGRGDHRFEGAAQGMILGAQDELILRPRAHVVLFLDGRPRELRGHARDSRYIAFQKA